MEHADKQPIYLKTLFFLYFIGLGIGGPFFGIFYKHVIVNADGAPAIGLIGIIFFVMPLVSLAANIPAAVLADKFHFGKHLIAYLCFGVAFFAVLIGLAGEQFAHDWPVGQKFAFIFVTLIFFNCCFLPISPVLDAETLLFLNRHSCRELYGTYRLWGTYGWSISAILMGCVLFYVRHDPLIFYGAAMAFALLGVFTLSGIQARPRIPPIIIPWSHIKHDTRFKWFLVFMFLTGVVSNAAASYAGYFFDDVMKSPLEIGLIFGTWTIFEIPVMAKSRTLIDRWGSGKLIVTGLLLNGIRLILFSLFTLETPFAWKWAAALLQGPGFALMHLGIIDFVDRQAHPDMRTTYLSIMNVARMSFASALGGILGSWLIEQWGSAFLMRFCGLGSIALMFFFAVLLKRHGARSSPR